MNLILLSDIHGNLPALEVALTHVEKLDAHQVLVAGDIVGDGPWPAETVDRLMELDVPVVRGNVDRGVTAMPEDEAELDRRARAGERDANRAWTALQLGAHRRHWLRSLPGQTIVEVSGMSILLLHGSPLGDTDYIYPSVTSQGMREKLRPLGGPRPDILVCGHSHLPFARQVNGVFVANAGSVGRAKDGDPRGSLVVLKLDDERRGPPRARVVRFDYPVDRVVQEVRARNVPGIRPDEYRLGIRVETSAADPAGAGGHAPARRSRSAAPESPGHR